MGARAVSSTVLGKATHGPCAPSCLTFCNPMDCSLPGSSVHGIFPSKNFPFPTPGDLPDSGIEPASLASQADSLLMSHWGPTVSGLISYWEEPVVLV